MSYEFRFFAIVQQLLRREHSLTTNSTMKTKASNCSRRWAGLKDRVWEQLVRASSTPSESKTVSAFKKYLSLDFLPPIRYNMPVLLC